MTGFVIRRSPFLTHAHDRALAFDSSHYPVDGIKEILIVDYLLVPAGRGKGSFVADIGYIGSGESGSMLGHGPYVKIRRNGKSAHMDLENIHTLVKVGQVDMDLAVETTGPHQSLVEDIGPVGRSKYDDTGIGVEPIHLSKKLIERVFPLVI